MRQEQIAENSAAIRLRTTRARQLQYERYRGRFLNGNAPSPSILEGCALSQSQRQYVSEVCYTQKWSNRTQLKLLRVARTIANLQGDNQLQDIYLQEAISWKLGGDFHG